MTKHRGLRTGEPETDLTFRTNVYPLHGPEKNDRLLAEIEAVLDASRCSIFFEMGELRISHLTHDYATEVRRILEGRRVLKGKYTLNEVK